MSINSKLSFQDIWGRDRFKEERAIAYGYRVIRVKQLYIFYHKNDWKQKLLDAIESMDSMLSIASSNLLPIVFVIVDVELLYTNHTVSVGNHPLFLNRSQSQMSSNDSFLLKSSCSSLVLGPIRFVNLSKTFFKN